MKSWFRTLALLAIILAVCAGTVWALLRAVLWFWARFAALNPTLSVGVLTAVTTVLVATLTVVLGRYYERKKELEAAYRQKKTEIYDEFLKEFFRIFHNVDETQGAGGEQVVAFLREWQRKIILWGGQEVLKAYVDWMRKLKSGEPDAGTMYKTEEFLRAIRADLGQGNWKLSKGTFLHFILREADLFVAASKQKPNITLAELAQMEAALQETQAGKALQPLQAANERREPASSGPRPSTPRR